MYGYHGFYSIIYYYLFISTKHIFSNHFWKILVHHFCFTRFIYASWLEFWTQNNVYRCHFTKEIYIILIEKTKTKLRCTVTHVVNKDPVFDAYFIFSHWSVNQIAFLSYSINCNKPNFAQTVSKCVIRNTFKYKNNS